MKRQGRLRLTKEAKWGYLFISPWILGLFVFTLGPILSAFYLSLFEYSVLEPPVFMGVKNYQKMFAEDPLFWKSLYNTVYYVGLRVPLHVGLAFILALLLNQGLRGTNLFRTAFYIPTVVPAVAMAAIWMWILDNHVGILKYALATLGLTAPNWFGSELWAKPTLIVMSLWHVGIIMVIFLAGLQDIPRDLYDAADVDGAGRWAKLIHITIPMMTPVIFFNVVIDIINSFQVFAAAFIITEGGPRNATLFYILYLYRHAFKYFQMGYAASLSVILFFIILSFTLLIFRSSRFWVHYERL